MKITELKKEDVDTYNLLLNVLNKAEYKIVGNEFKGFQRAFTWLDNVGIALSEGWNAANDPKNKNPASGPANVKIKNPEPSKLK